jgi:hypothetical protein
MNKKINILIVFVLLAGLLSACGLQSPNNEAPRQLNISGMGEVYLVPDIAYVYIGTRSEAVEVGDALSQNNQQAQNIAKVLTDMGVDQKDIQTTAFNVYPVQNYGPEGEPMETRFVVENTVFIKVRELQKLGELLDVVVRNGANQINGISFNVEDREQAEADARRLAVIDAKQKAEELAEAAGVRLGELVNLSAYSYGNPQPLYEGKGGGYAADMSAAPIASGQLLITAEASLTYNIK